MGTRNLADGGRYTAPKPKPVVRTPRGSADALANNASMRAAAARRTPIGSADALANNPSMRANASDPHNWAGIAAALAAQDNYPSHYRSADAEAMAANPDEESAAIEAGALRSLAPAPAPTRISGSGRSTGESTGGDLGAPAPVFAPPQTYTAPPAVVQPPAVVAQAPESSVNVPGQSFTSVGNPNTTFGGYERRRQARGPRNTLSVTPEMIRRAASQRLG